MLRSLYVVKGGRYFGVLARLAGDVSIQTSSVSLRSHVICILPTVTLWQKMQLNTELLQTNQSVKIAKMPSKSNLRIGNVSGATGDHPHAMVRMATSGQVDVITGDWLSEMNIAWNAIVKKDFPDLGYEAGFLAQLEESIDSIVSNKIKVITNAGALNTLALTKKVRELCQSKGFVDIVIASVLGDDVSDLVTSTQGKGGAGKLMHLDYEDRFLEDWELEPYCGAAYIGAAGIKKALQEGADIVICGRVTDASPVIGASQISTYHFYDLLTNTRPQRGGTTGILKRLTMNLLEH